MVFLLRPVIGARRLAGRPEQIRTKRERRLSPPFSSIERAFSELERLKIEAQQAKCAAADLPSPM
jgi:hypothetical protein